MSGLYDPTTYGLPQNAEGRCRVCGHDLDIIGMCLLCDTVSLTAKTPPSSWQLLYQALRLADKRTVRWYRDTLSYSIIPAELLPGGLVLPLNPRCEWNEYEYGERRIEIIPCIAWDLVGLYSDLVDTSHEIRMSGGKYAWHGAFATPNGKVRIERLVPGQRVEDGLSIARRYLDADARVTLVPIKK